MTNDTTNRAKIRRQIDALLAKTVDRGATEAEALAAAEKASELMAQYDIDMGELGYKESMCLRATCQFTKHGRTRIGQYFMAAIGSLCDVKPWYSSGQVTFYGFESDTKIAVYLFTTLSNAVVRELTAWKRTDDYARANEFQHGKTLSSSFINGMEMRLAERLREMARNKQGDVSKATGTDLVIVKSRQVEAAFRGEGVRLRSSSSTRRVGSSSGYGAGRKAGDRVAIHGAITA